MQENFDKIIGKIAQTAGLDVEEVKRRIEAKRAKLSGLISPEGAAQVVAAELGVNFDNEKLKLDELLPGMRKVNTVGKIISMSPVRTFKTQKGDEGKVVNFVLADDKSNIKIVLWDTNHISLIEKGEVGENDSVEISNASMRDNELHLGSFSEMKKSSQVFENVVTEKVVKSKDIFEFRFGDNASVRAFIVHNFQPRFFYVCPECKKKAVQEGEGFNCATHGKVVPEKRALMNITLDDGTETIRAVLFSDALKQIGFDSFEDVEKMNSKIEDILGREFVFSGNVRRNNYFNNEEFIVETVKELDLDGIISKLEN